MTDNTRTLTRPLLPLLIILAVLAFVVVLVVMQFSRLSEFFFAQPAINGAILLVAFLSALLIIWEVASLGGAVSWVEGVKVKGRQQSSAAESVTDIPQLLYPLQSIMSGKDIQVGYSAENLSIVMDAVKARNDERRDLSQYLLQLLIFLGLFGTFWGLILTVSDIGNAIGTLNSDTGTLDAGGLFATMIESLEAPIGSMGIAFSSSLFGLAGSIVVGFLEQQSSQAHGRFLDELENWLYQHAIVADAQERSGGGFNVASTANFMPASASLTDETLDATNQRLEQIEVGLSRNHDALIQALQALVAIQEDRKQVRKEEHGKLSSLAMLTDTNERMSSIMENWSLKSDQYFNEASKTQVNMLKLTDDMEKLLRSRDTTRTLNDRLAELSRELGENSRRTENAFTNLRDFLSGNETGNQLQALLDSMESSRAEIHALRVEAQDRDNGKA